MIEVKKLVKKYGARAAVDDISFTVPQGQITGFLGPNGAGKTTTMNILTGYISSTSGSVKVAGFDILEQPMELKKHIGYLPEHPPLYGDMRVVDYLRFVFELKKIKLDIKEHIRSIMDVVGITHVKGRIIKNLSKGYQQRVGLAQALIGNPDVLILDEPTVGLDPNQIIEIRNLIRDLGKKHTVILSTHILPEVEAVCDTIMIINNGKLVAQGTAESLLEQVSGPNKLVIRILGEREQIISVLKEMAGVVTVNVQREGEPGAFDYLVQCEKENDIRSKIISELSAKNLPVLMIKNFDATLEDVFTRITRSEGGES